MPSNQTRPCLRSSDGYVVPVAVLLALAMVGISALSIDAGRALYRRFQIQTAADAAALAGAIPLGRFEPNDSVVRLTVEDYAARNAINLGLELDAVECGIWDGKNRAFTSCDPSAPPPGGGIFGGGGNKQVTSGNLTDTADSVEGTLETACQNCADIRTNALRVKMHHREPTIFGRLFGIEALSPTVSSVTIYVPGQMPVRPLGIPDNVIVAGNVVPYEFTIGAASPGNWGKVDIGLLCIPPPGGTCVEPGGGSGQMRGVPDFSQAMLDGVLFKRDPGIGPNPAYPGGMGHTGEAPAVEGFYSLVEGEGLNYEPGTELKEQTAHKNIREALCYLMPDECVFQYDYGPGGPHFVIPVLDHTYNGGQTFPNGHSNAGRVRVVRWARIRWLAREDYPDDPPLTGANWQARFRVEEDPYYWPNSILPDRKLVD